MPTTVLPPAPAHTVRPVCTKPSARCGRARFSFSVFNSEGEADMAIQAVKELAQSK